MATVPSGSMTELSGARSVISGSVLEADSAMRGIAPSCIWIVTSMRTNMNIQSDARTNLEFLNNVRTFLNSRYDPIKPMNQRTKAEARGKAARWHGYDALLGFGMTRIRNQSSARKPIR